MTTPLPPRVRYQGRTFTREQVQTRIDEVADYYRNHDRPLLMKDTLTCAAVEYLQRGILPLDNYTTR